MGTQVRTSDRTWGRTCGRPRIRTFIALKCCGIPSWNSKLRSRNSWNSKWKVIKPIKATTGIFLGATMTNKRIKSNTSAVAAREAGATILKVVGENGAAALRIPGSANRFAVPSTSIPYHKYIVHLSPSGSRDSCTCPAHKLQRIRPCKHAVALKKLLRRA